MTLPEGIGYDKIEIEGRDFLIRIHPRIVQSNIFYWLYIGQSPDEGLCQRSLQEN